MVGTAGEDRKGLKKDRVKKAGRKSPGICGSQRMRGFRDRASDWKC